MRAAGIVLVGGRSSRMGRDKAALPWGDSTLLAQVCTVLGEALDGPVAVVRAAGQVLPALPAGVEVHDDPSPGLGPVQGVAAGLHAVADRAALAFVAATDLPLLREAVVRRVVRELADRPDGQVAAPEVGGHPQLLAAAYRTDAAGVLAAALASGERRLRAAVSGLSVLRLPPEALLADPDVAAADPDLRSFTNLNDPGAYARAVGARTG